MRCISSAAHASVAHLRMPGFARSPAAERASKSDEASATGSSNGMTRNSRSPRTRSATRLVTSITSRGDGTSAITVIGLEFTFLIGGLVVTEQVFNLNGIGQLFVQSVSRNDFTLIQGMVMLIAAFYVFVNLVIDLLYAVFDPRIRYGS